MYPMMTDAQFSAIIDRLKKSREEKNHEFLEHARNDVILLARQVINLSYICNALNAMNTALDCDGWDRALRKASRQELKASILERRLRRKYSRSRLRLENISLTECLGEEE